MDNTKGSNEDRDTDIAQHLKRNHEPSKARNVGGKNELGNSEGTSEDNDGEQIKVSSSPPRKKLVAALKNKMENENRLSNMALAHEIALDDKFKLPDPSERLNISPEDSPMEAEKKRMEKAVKEVVQKAFWDNVRIGIESDPPKYEHAFILLQEIKGILLSLLPTNRVTTIHKSIEEVLDMQLLQQQAQNDTLNVKEVALFIINTMASLCAPVRDAEVDALRSIDDTVDLFQRMYAVLDQMKIDLANFHIQTVRPHIQQQQFEYERSTFAKLVQKSPNGMKKTHDWIKATFVELNPKNDTTSQTNTNSSHEVSTKKPGLTPLLVLKAAYSKLLTWDYTKDDFPETLEMDKKRYSAIQQQVNQMALVASCMVTSCGVLGQPLASNQAFTKNLLEILFTLTKQDTDKKVEDVLDAIYLQVWKEAVEYTMGKGVELERCVTKEKEAALRSKIVALNSLHSHPVYEVLHKRITEYMRAVTDTLAGHNSVTSPTLPPPPSSIMFLVPQLVSLSLAYAKLVNLNQTVYGPFYVPILREILQLPQTPTAESSTCGGKAKKKLDLEKSSNSSETTNSEEIKAETVKVTGTMSTQD